MLEIRMLILCCLLQSRYQLPLSVSSRLTGDDVMIRARVLNCVDGVNIALLQKAINEQRSFFRERESKQGEAAQAADATWSGTSLIKFPSVLRDDQSYITSSWAVCQRALCCCVSSNEQKDCLVRQVYFHQFIWLFCQSSNHNNFFALCQWLIFDNQSCKLMD